VATLVIEREPLVCVLAKFVIVFVAFVVKFIVPAPRTIRFFIVIPPATATDIPEPENSVNTPDPTTGIKFVPTANVPIVINPELTSPIRALVVRIRLRDAWVKPNVPTPPPKPMVVPAVPSVRIVFVALPVANALPPICEVAFNAMLFAAKLIVPVESNNEPAPVVNVPLPAL